MKKLIILLIINFNLYAQGNSDLDNWQNGNSPNAGGLNGNAPAASIDTYLLIMFTIGIIYYLTLNKKKQ